MFEPVALDQELPVFGIGGLWEGAGTVSGTHHSTAIRGNARLELHGYSYAPTFRGYLANLAARKLLGARARLFG